MGFAFAASKRGDCTRRKIGAVIIKRNRIVSSGYNGAPEDEDGCLTKGACPRGQLSNAEIAPGSSYDTGPGSCIAVHAEQNALLQAGFEARGATLYITDTPCDGCARLIAGARIARVVTPTDVGALSLSRLHQYFD
jgi:dCMP deaminase